MSYQFRMLFEHVLKSPCEDPPHLKMLLLCKHLSLRQVLNMHKLEW